MFEVIVEIMPDDCAQGLIGGKILETRGLFLIADRFIGALQNGLIKPVLTAKW